MMTLHWMKLQQQEVQHYWHFSPRYIAASSTCLLGRLAYSDEELEQLYQYNC
jgi:hypothetical protein